MRAVDVILKKRDGGELSRDEIQFFVSGVTAGSLPDYQASALLMAVPAAFHARINDVMLGALAVAVADWRRARGHEGTDGSVLVDLEGHGREPMAGGIDLSRTVGWFTSLFPVGLDVGPIDIDEALAGGPSMGRALKRVKEQLRAIPFQGLLDCCAISSRGGSESGPAVRTAGWLQLSGTISAGV
jgi:hypothetical protein